MDRKHFRIWSKEEKRWMQWMELREHLYLDGEDGKDRRGHLFAAFDLTGIEIVWSTGRHDKNGAEIYEGDILKSRFGMFDVVFTEWKEEHQAGHGESIENLCIGYHFDTWTGFPEECEILGNIHENPELLKGGNNEQEQG